MFRRLLYPICLVKGHDWLWGTSEYCPRCTLRMNPTFRSINDRIRNHDRAG